MWKSLIVVLGILTAFPAIADEKSQQKTLDKYSYILGYQIGERLKGQGLKVNIDSFGQALRDVGDEKPSKYTKAESAEISRAWKQVLKAQQAQAGAENLVVANEYLESNKTRDGVTTTEQGIQYEVIKSGDGKQPKAKSTVVVHYRGTLTNGDEFDSSYSRDKPAVFVLNQVIKGWQYALQLMHEGDKWKVAIPPALAYGERGFPPKIGPNSALVFEIELIEVR